MNMKRHILDVHVNKNIKPFKCTMCSFASHAKRYLLWHVRRHHNPNNPPGGDPKGTHTAPLVFSTETKSSMDSLAFAALICIRQFRISQEKHLSSGFQNSLL